MSNLHKDLVDAQIHVPKGFVNAANSTKLTKNASGVLEWVADSGGGGGVSQIVAGTNITISPTGGTGVVTINSTASATNNAEYFTKGYYTNVGDGRTPSSNWSIKTWNRENLHFVDTGTNGTSFNFTSPMVGVGSSFAIIPTSSNLVRLNGVFSIDQNANVTIGLFKARPDCSGRLLRTANLIGSTGNITAAANAAMCFDITASPTSVQAGEILLLGAITNVLNSNLAYNATQLIEY
jgi:hypothetical protein